MVSEKQIEHSFDPPITAQKSINWLTVFLAVVVAVFLLGVGIYVGANYFIQPEETVPIVPSVPTSKIEASPAEGEITGWQIHRNTKFGWEFKYPSGWMVKPASASGEWADPEEAVYGDWVYKSLDDPRIVLEIGTTGKKTKEECYAFIDPDNKIEKSKVIVNNIEWIKLEGDKLVYYKTLHEKSSTCVSANPNPQIFKDISLLDIVNQILSTFKFQ